MSKKKSKKPSYVPLLQRITTVHGTSHFSTLRGQSLKLWCFIMVANIALTVAFVMVIKQKFNENQIVTQINANCKVSQVPFPAVSICNFNMVSSRDSSNIVQVLKNYNVTQDDIRDFFNALPLLKDFNKKSRNIGHFDNIMRILKRHYFTIDTIMEEIHQKCEDLLLHCSFNRKQMKCENIFRLIKTFEGFCCAFNYAALNDGNEMPLLPSDADLEYYDDQNQVGTPQTGTIISTSESGRALTSDKDDLVTYHSSGLKVVINVEPNDYPSWSHVPYYGAKVMITDPNDYPETTILYRYITLGDSVDIKLEAMVFQSESDLRRVDPVKRGCWFYDEVVLEHTDRYSYETCNSECRMQTYLKSCGCIPFKYPRERSTRVCEFEDLLCLNNVTVFKSKKEMDCKPTCYQECRDKKYAITSDLVPFHGDGLSPDIIQKHNVSELAELQVYFGKSNCNCYKLMLLVDVNYFIATYGGVFSLCFGGSILTLFELSYLVIDLVVKVAMRAIRNAIRDSKHGRRTINRT